MNVSAASSVSPALLETLSAHAEASDLARSLADESVAAMREAGLFRALVPRRAGGDEGDLRVMLEMVSECARGCSSAAWVLMVSTGHDWIMASFPEQAQDEVWADPNLVSAGSLAPAGVIERCEDGWSLSGRWGFVSGAAHGSWFLMGTVDQSGERPRLYHAIVPRSDLELDDNWHALGLRGTGSVEVVADKVLVPEHRVMDSGVLFGARSEWASRHATNTYKIPIMPGLAVHAGASSLGLARGAIDAASELMGVQSDKYTGRKKLDRPGLHTRFAEAKAEVLCAEKLLDSAIDLLEQAANGSDSLPLRAEAKFQACYAVELCRRSVNRLIAATGARSVFDDSPLQKAFRDVTMATKHQTVNFDEASLVYGRTLVGLDTKGFIL